MSNEPEIDEEVPSAKGRTRWKIPITSTLDAALRRLSTVRSGLVLRNDDGSVI